MRGPEKFIVLIDLQHYALFFFQVSFLCGSSFQPKIHLRYTMKSSVFSLALSDIFSVSSY